MEDVLGGNGDRHIYEYDVVVSGNTAPARVVRMVGNNKRVLELGAGPGSITKMLKMTGNCKVTGLEIDKESIKKLAPFCERVYEANLNDSTWPELLSDEAPFEVLVGADVLEHVYEPTKVLKAIAGLAGSKGQIVISLPHIGHNAIMACILNEDFEYRDWGLLDKTHIRFFGLKNMKQMFHEAGLKIIAAEFVITPPQESEFADKWEALSEEMQLALSRHPYGQVYQVVIKAVSQVQEGTEIDLMDVPVEGYCPPENPVFAVGWTRTLARRYLSEKTRYRLLRIIRKQ